MWYHIILYFETDWSRICPLPSTTSHAPSTMKTNRAVFWKGWRKLNSVASEWNHKIYLSRHYQTLIFLRDQLQLPCQCDHPPPSPPPLRVVVVLSQEPFRPYNYTSRWVWFPQIQTGTRLNAARSLEDYYPNWLGFHLPHPQVQPYLFMEEHLICKCIFINWCF